MQAFAYARPGALSEAFSLLAEHGGEAVVLAGGTDLVVGLRDRTSRPKLVIDLKGVRELRTGIRESGPWLSVGAASVLSDLTEDRRVQARFPALVEAASTVGSIQIRNRATLAGNICHASPAADTAPALLVYGAVVNVASAHGTRRVPIDDFIVGPKQTALQAGELVTSIDLPAPAPRHGASFARLTRRRGVDLATINLCCLVDSSGRTTFAYGAVGPRPFVVADESGVLASPDGDDAAKDQVLQRLLGSASPISDVRGSREYREAMLMVMSRRSLRTAIARLRAA